MRFTIVTPTLNGMPWLPQAVRSVAAQRADVDLEHLVLDGGSTDGSREWLVANPEPDRELIFERDGSQTEALIRGFERATGELLGWLNGDDILEPGTLGRVHELFAANPDVVMISGACLLIDARGSITGAMSTPPDPTFQGLVTKRVNPAQPATFFRTSAYRITGGLDPRWDLAMDVDLWLRLARVGRYLVIPDQILARYRVHADAKSERMAIASAMEDLRIRRAQGMPWRSPAGAELIRRAYLDRILRPIRRATVGIVRRTVSDGG